MQISGLKKELIIVLVTAVGTLLATSVGVVLTNHFTKAQWEYEQRYQLQKDIYQKRLHLIEETASVFAKSPGIQESFFQYKKNIISGDSGQNIQLSMQLADYNAEYYKILIEDQLYFGDETKKVIFEMGEKNIPWWEQPKENVNKLLGTMHQELMIGMKSDKK